jgi:hypothetical protein
MEMIVVTFVSESQSQKSSTYSWYSDDIHSTFSIFIRLRLSEICFAYSTFTKYFVCLSHLLKLDSFDCFTGWLKQRRRTTSSTT